MTREETLHRFKEWCQQYIGNNCSEEDYHMANNIIALLEQEPCGDAISRQAVLDIAKSSKSNWIDNSVLFKRVNELPPVTPQQIGHWILYRDHKNMIDYPQCDNCDVIIKLPLPIDNLNFCPNCGRKMEEEE